MCILFFSRYPPPMSAVPGHCSPLPADLDFAGYYVKRFPPRSGTSYGDITPRSPSPMTPRHRTSQWRRAPSATRVTFYEDAGTVPEPNNQTQSDILVLNTEGSTGSEEQGKT